MNILIVGASGFVGGVLMKGLSMEHEVAGTYNSIEKPGLMELDVRDKNSVELLVRKIMPDVVVDTAALPHVDYCQEHEDESHAINVEGTRNVAEACAKFGCGMVFISTDYLFDGKEGPYSEYHKPNPINVYGRHKLEAEGAIAETLEDYLIARTTVVYGWEKEKKNFAARTVDNLRSGKPMKVPSDQWGNPTYAENLAEALKELVEKRGRGVYNIAGSGYCTRLEFALKIAEVFKLDASLISGVDTRSLKQKAPRPLKGGFRIDKAKRELKTHLLSMEEGLKLMKKSEDKGDDKGRRPKKKD